jgi:polyisoprenyl-phosphate glycosyltransferase
MDDGRPLLSVIIPVFDEEHGLVDTLDTLCKSLAEVAGRTELIVIDDGSSDDTWKVLSAYRSGFGSFCGLRLSRNFGKEAALCAGLEIACGSAVVTMDGDLQHPPDLILKMLKYWQEDGYDIVEAVKKSRGTEGALNRLGASSFYSVLNWLSGFNLKDASDFKLMNRRAVNALCDMGEKNVFFRGMSNWIGFDRKKIEFHVAERLAGESKWSKLSLLKLAMTAISAFSALPLQLVTLLGSLLLLFSMALGVQTFANWWAGTAVDGFTTVILLQLFIGSIVMISLGIIGMYIARIYTEVKGRPRFIVSDRVLDKKVQ